MSEFLGSRSLMIQYINTSFRSQMIWHKWAFLIENCIVSAIVVVVYFSPFNAFSKTNRPISTKLGTKHSWVQGIQVNFVIAQGPRLISGGDKENIGKCFDNFQKSFSIGNFNQTWHISSLGDGYSIFNHVC